MSIEILRTRPAAAGCVRQTDVAGNTSRPSATALAFTLSLSSPLVTGIAAAPLKAYATGGLLTVVVTFSRPVRVSGRSGSMPTIDVTIGSQTLSATYATGSGGTQVAFRCRLGAAAFALAATAVFGPIRLPLGSIIQDLAGNRFIPADVAATL